MKSCMDARIRRFFEEVYKETRDVIAPYIFKCVTERFVNEIAEEIPN